MVKHKNRIYRLLTKQELQLRTYVYELEESDTYCFFIADLEYVAVKK